MRSWGGVIGINSIRPLVDGGIPAQPNSTWWDSRRGWDMENRGVEPAIVVQSLSQELGRDVDTQLERGIQEVLRLQAEYPPLEPKFEPLRQRSREDYRKESMR